LVHDGETAGNAGVSSDFRFDGNKSMDLKRILRVDDAKVTVEFLRFK
jgi:hypothetical protein